MRRNKHLPLTETVFYILASLVEPGHGYAIMQKIEELSDGDVRMAAGTLYGAIDNLLKLGFIQQVPSDEPRRKVYQLTTSGREMLQLDTRRMKHMVSVAEKLLSEGKP